MAVAVVVPVLLAARGLWYFVLRHDTPAVATLEEAVAGVQAAGAPSAPSGTPSAPEGTAVNRTWTIDPTITNSQGTGSYAGFRVGEVLAGIGATTAVGGTPTVEGTLTVQDDVLTAATVSADLRAVTSDDSRWDGAIQRALDTSRYPNATFVLTEPVVAGTTEVSFADYGVTAPSAPIVASVEDHASVPPLRAHSQVPHRERPSGGRRVGAMNRSTARVRAAVCVGMVAFVLGGTSALARPGERTVVAGPTAASSTTTVIATTPALASDDLPTDELSLPAALEDARVDVPGPPLRKLAPTDK